MFDTRCVLTDASKVCAVVHKSCREQLNPCSAIVSSLRFWSAVSKGVSTSASIWLALLEVASSPRWLTVAVLERRPFPFFALPFFAVGVCS